MSEKKNSDIIKQEAQAEKNSTFEEFNENTLRVRRNLLIFSVIALFYKLSGATLTGKSSFLGLEFEHTDPEMIDLFLFWIVGYHLIHFQWLELEHFAHYKIRYWTKFGVENKEVTSLWSLFVSIKKFRLKTLIKDCEQTKNKYEQFKLKIKNSEVNKEKLDKIGLEVEVHENRIKKIEGMLGNMKKDIKKESETRFIKLNKWRHFLIETTFPLLIACFALLALKIL